VGGGVGLVVGLTQALRARLAARHTQLSDGTAVRPATSN